MQTLRQVMAVVGILGCVSAAVGQPAAGTDRYWPQWRGPMGTGIAPQADPPLTWSEGKNVRWKINLPGEGNSSPIVWGDRVFVQTAIRTDRTADASELDKRPPPTGFHRASRPDHVYQFVLLAFDRRTGKEVLRRVLREELPHEGAHETSTLQATSPVTDGQHVYAYFGSHGLFCLTMDGKPVWDRDLGDMRTRNGFGEGGSPALHGDTLVVNWDHEGDSFIIALDKNTGKTRWRKDRDEVTTWATPLIVTDGPTPTVVVPATKYVRGYGLADGREIWRCGGLTTNCIPTPVSAGGWVYVTSGYRGKSMLALRVADARGDLTGTPAVAWTFDKFTPYVPSPIAYAGGVYFLDTNRAILSCLDAKTGKPWYTQKRLTGMAGAYASPVASRDRIYFVGRRGTTVVIKPGKTFEVLATNKLDDGFDASPALVDREIYLRSRDHLYCIASP